MRGLRVRLPSLALELRRRYDDRDTRFDTRFPGHRLRGEDMEVPRSTPKVRSDKPAKPYPDFPLFPHATKRWAKKIKGRLVYFGRWNDPQAALQRYLDQREDLYAGRTPRARTDAVSVKGLVNEFLSAKRDLVDTREVTARTWTDYYKICEKVVAVLGRNRPVDDLRTEDFDKLRRAFAQTHGLVSLRSDLTRVRAIFNWGVKKGHIGKRDYSALISRPTAGALRRDRLGKAKRVFSRDELLSLIEGSKQPLRAMILLAINTGYGNQDVALLTTDYLDLAGGWVDMGRPKTGAQRKMKLWPETVVALRDAIQHRPKPKDRALANRVFLTARGLGWEARTKLPPTNELGKPTAYEDNPISKQFAKLLDLLEIHRTGNGFYTLRRMFETVGGGCGDQVAVDFAMGHMPGAGDMGAVYRQYVDDSRLETLAGHVHRWLFGDAKSGPE